MRYKSLVQIIRYGLIGLFSNLIGYVIYLVSTRIGVAPKLAASIIYFISALIGFWGNRKLTFAHQGRILGTGVRYVVAHLFGYVLNISILAVMVDKFRFDHRLVQGGAIIVVAGFLFVVFKFFVFRAAIVTPVRHK